MPNDANDENFSEIRQAVAALCERFPGEYWRQLDRERTYPKAFVDALTEAGYLAALIPETYGGSGLPVAAGVAILEEIHRSGCNGAACHAQMYTMGTVLRHGSKEQKQTWLPRIAKGELRAYLRKHLSHQKTPALWFVIDEFPLTGSGKIQKFELRKRWEAGVYEEVE